MDRLARLPARPRSGHAMSRPRHLLQLSLQRIVHQHLLKILPLLMCEIEHALPDRGGDISVPHRVTSASTKGRITACTRQIRAIASSSSKVKRCRCKPSRSASMPTSSPTRLRNLKRSATVFATEYTRTTPPCRSTVSIPAEYASPEKCTIRNSGYSSGLRQALFGSANETLRNQNPLRREEIERSGVLYTAGTPHEESRH